MAVERKLVKWQLQGRTRKKLRLAVLMKWAEEKRGSADAYQRYRYNVEHLPNDGLVYLHRPAFKNKGCDFVVHCDPLIPRHDGKKYKNPRHKDLIRELKLLSRRIKGGKTRVLAAVESVHACKNVTYACKALCRGVHGKWAFRAERALKVAKWLFIEQDITDWNTSGRDMLMNSIRKSLR